jgi:hypothetical protein
MRKGWFGPKRIGWGVSPRSWEGWVATLVFVAGLAASVRLLGSVAILAILAVWIGLFMLVVWATYDRNA